MAPPKITGFRALLEHCAAVLRGVRGRVGVRIAGLALLLGSLLLLGACEQKTKSDPATAARTFLEQVARGETGPAFQSTAFGFHSQLSEKAFATTAGELGLVGGSIESLELAEQTPDSAKFKLSMLTAPKKEPRPFILTMQLESGAWRVFSLRSPRDPKTGISENRFSIVGKTTAFNEAVSKAIPSEREMRRLVSEAMQAFAEAVKQRSFAGFYQHVSQAWQAQLTERQLQRAFQSFIDKEVDLSGTAQVEPIFDTTPQVTTDGLLLISGHYSTKPFEVHFAFKYTYELPEWKLFGVDVYLRRVAGAGTPVPAATPAP